MGHPKENNVLTPCYWTHSVQHAKNKVWHIDFEHDDLQRLDFYMRHHVPDKEQTSLALRMHLYELRRICQRRFP